jgi:hypothetical protein
LALAAAPACGSDGGSDEGGAAGAGGSSEAAGSPTSPSAGQSSGGAFAGAAGGGYDAGGAAGGGPALLPETELDSVPPQLTKATSAELTFSSDDPEADFECRLDIAEFEPCTSPFQIDALALGAHTFEVRATNATGADPTPASTDWVVYEPVVVFAASSAGNMGGREGADGLCEQALAGYPQLSGLETHAFLCVATDDAVVDMPENYGVPVDVPLESVTGGVLAASWDDFVSTGLTASLEEAGVLPSSTATLQAFVGCGVGGTMSGCNHRCAGFTVALDTSNACVAHSDLTTSNWLAWGNILSCDQVLSFLCVAY